ncbi:hypothetical protein ACTRXD_12715 [Nitrospira sp. T9]|uniref:hypothetical protein n=1 Tax=unclassified Nitrospira TaxID=2652172 RepID=UPI003F9B4C13
MLIPKGIFILIFLLVLEFPANADIFSPSHSCSKPYKPFQFETEADYENFLYQVKNYKACIQDFVEEQEEKSKNTKMLSMRQWRIGTLL